MFLFALDKEENTRSNSSLPNGASKRAIPRYVTSPKLPTLLIGRLVRVNALRVIGCAFAARPSLAFKGLCWWLLRRRVRGRRMLFLAAAEHPNYYRLWIETTEQARIEAYLKHASCRLARVSNSLPNSWVALLICRSGDDLHQIETTVKSAQQARARIVVVGDELTLEQWENCFQIPLSQSEALADLLSEVGGRWLVPLSAGDLVSPALGEILSATTEASPATKIVYWDEDYVDANGIRSRPWLKPSWDELYFLGRDGVSRAAAYDLNIVLSLDGGFVSNVNTLEWQAELAVRLVAANRENSIPLHVPLILSHRTRATASQRGWPEFVKRHWPEPLVLCEPGGGRPAHLHLPEPQAWPRVSIIVPTRDRLDLLQNCLAGIYGLAYKGEVEVIIADNDSCEPETFQFFAEQMDRGVRVVPCPGPFNFASINNRAAREATGSIVCLLNNDVQVLDGHWLARMVIHAIRPGVGAVGALLLYPDQTVQHCGVAIGIGGAAGHVYRGIGLNEEGNRFTHLCTRQVSAVTAACLVVSRSVFDQVGGLDEELFAVAFNDVDFCLKLKAAGFKNVFVAEAQLVHHESKSRGDDMSPANKERYVAELARLKSRWHTDQAIDLFHNPLLSREGEEFILAL